ncbi:MAG TPA: trigger factor [Candidatus Dormibacteraeota bacterium]|nr:trigger factor [Candidatus Dormibacteraeota bacterium]
MQVSLERRPGSVVELQIEVPTEQVERAIELAFQHLSPRVRVAGFRPGKAPRAVLEREIGWPALREHALEHLVPEAIGDAVKENNLEIIATPEVEVEQFERLQPAKLKARVTVKPDVTLGDVDAVKAPLEQETIGEDRVNEALDQVRESLAQLVPADNRRAKDGDHLVIDLVVKKDGEPIDENPTENMELDIDKERLIPGLYEGLLGMGKDETKAISVHLPDDYRRAELAGKDVDFNVTVKEIKEHELPPLDDELAKTAGAGETLDELRSRLQERLQVAADRDAVFKQQKDAIDALVASSTVEVPELLVNEEVDREIRNLAINLGQQGIDLDTFFASGSASLEEMRQERREPAIERVRQELVLDALAEKQGLEPSDEHAKVEANRSLAGAEDAERLAGSDRVQAYVKERMRLQWALLWLAAHARGEGWSPPAPGEDPAGLPESAAASEITDSPGVEAPAPAEPAGVEAAAATDASPAEPDAGEAAPQAPEREDGMVDI